MTLLPPLADADRFFADVHGLPLECWRGGLTVLAHRHGLPDGPLERAALGRSVVFLSATTVVKLGPPCWPGDVAREADQRHPQPRERPAAGMVARWLTAGLSLVVADVRSGDDRLLGSGDHRP